jgi:hypothetical protein
MGKGIKMKTFTIKTKIGDKEVSGDVFPLDVTLHYVGDKDALYPDDYSLSIQGIKLMSLSMKHSEALKIARFVAKSDAVKRSETVPLEVLGCKNGPLHQLVHTVQKKFDLFNYGNGYQINPFRKTT